MLRFLVVIASILSVVACQKMFGPFYVETKSVSHPVPENDVVHYYFQVSKKGKKKKQVDAKIEFLRRVEDLQASGSLFKKNRDSKADDYYQAYPRSAPKSLCTNKMFPVFKESFTGKLNEQDCSMEKGKYQLVDYSVDEELRRYVGDKTFYGDYKIRVFFTDGKTNEDIIVFDLVYSVLPIDESPGASNSNKKSKPKKS